MSVSDRQLIEAAVRVLSDGQPRTASGISRVIREVCYLSHRCDRIGDLMDAAFAEGIVMPAPRLKGCRSTVWTVGSTPLPDWFGRGPKPEPEPAVEPEPTDDTALTALDMLRSLLDMWRSVDARLTAIEATLADLTIDRTPRPLFDAARRNGH